MSYFIFLHAINRTESEMTNKRFSFFQVKKSGSGGKEVQMNVEWEYYQKNIR